MMLLIIIFYCVSFGLSIFNRGVYWDDWAMIVGKNPEFIRNVLGHQLGNIIGAYFIIWLNGFHSYTVYRIVTFLAYLFSGYFVYSVLRSIKEIGKKMAGLLTLFYILIPANDARVLLIISAYTFANFFFFYGCWLVSLYTRSRKKLTRLAALIAFLLSFSINSFLLFYILVLVYIAYGERKQLTNWSAIVYFVIHSGDFIMLPFLFYVWKSMYFRPFGLYEGYNSIFVGSLTAAAYKSLGAYTTSFTHILTVSVQSLLRISSVSTVFVEAGIRLGLHLSTLSGKNIIDLARTIFDIFVLEFPKNGYFINTASTVLAVILVYKLLFPRIEMKNTHKVLRLDIQLFLSGCALYFLAVFPYYAVDKIPKINTGFEDRHLLLVPLGASFMLVYGIKLIAGVLRLHPRSLIAVYSIFTAMFISYHIRMNIDYLKDWYQQTGIMAQMGKSSMMREHTSFLFRNNMNENNVNNRPYEVYEYAGMMKMVFGDERRFAINIDGSNRILPGLHTMYGNDAAYMYNMRQYVSKSPEYIIEINPGTFRLSDKNLIYLLFTDYFNTKAHEIAVQHIAQFITIPVTEDNF